MKKVATTQEVLDYSKKHNISYMEAKRELKPPTAKISKKSDSDAVNAPE